MTKFQPDEKIKPENLRAPRNRTLTLNDADQIALRPQLLFPSTLPFALEEIENKIICADLLDSVKLLPNAFVDLMIIDPPYNLVKNFHGYKFSKTGDDEYIAYLDSWFPLLLRLLKPSSTIYMCGDWHSSAQLYMIMSKYLKIRNRIVWQREKGRGAKTNWKNCTEDIWFGTVSDEYYFNSDAVKQRKKVLAPYKANGVPKDWEETADGKFRHTGASNFWNDITVPYWSMPENTDHPTQKPEKLIAKLLLASSRENDMIFDPFAGAGTSFAVAKKLNRRFCGVEFNEEYCLWAQARVNKAEEDKRIQGFENGVFLERNTH